MISGVAWTWVYIEIIRQGNKDKTCGMPLWALTLNIVWEVIYSYKGLQGTPILPQTWINIVWTILDLVIVGQYLKYNKDKIWFGLVLIMSIGLQLTFLVEFGKMGPVYSAFLQNLLMSGLFIDTLANKGAKGQNMIIAWAKWLGTLAPTILFGVIRSNQLVVVVGLCCSILDFTYIWLLSKELKNRDSLN